MNSTALSDVVVYLHHLHEDCAKLLDLVINASRHKPCHHEFAQLDDPCSNLAKHAHQFLALDVDFELCPNWFVLEAIQEELPVVQDDVFPRGAVGIRAHYARALWPVAAYLVTAWKLVVPEGRLKGYTVANRRGT